MTDETDEYAIPAMRGRDAGHRRAVAALAAGAARGWFVHRYTGPGVGAARVYEVEVGGVRRRLIQPEVLPWVLGVADAHGQPGAVTYRAGLSADPAGLPEQNS